LPGTTASNKTTSGRALCFKGFKFVDIKQGTSRPYQHHSRTSSPFQTVRGKDGDSVRLTQSSQSIAGRQPNELFVRRFTHRRGRQRDLRQLVEPLLLFLDQELGV